MGDFNKELRSVALMNALEITSIDDRLMLSLARELAMDIHEIDTILANHGMSMEQFEPLTKNTHFISILREETIKWGSAKSASERIKAKAESMVEMALPELFAELCKPGISPAKVELVKTLMRAGGVGVSVAEQGGGERINISIVMGEAPEAKIKKDFVIDHEAEEAA